MNSVHFFPNFSARLQKHVSLITFFFSNLLNVQQKLHCMAPVKCFIFSQIQFYLYQIIQNLFSIRFLDSILMVSLNVNNQKHI